MDVYPLDRPVSQSPTESNKSSNSTSSPISPHLRSSGSCPGGRVDNELDLEKAPTQGDDHASATGRATRVQSLTRRRNQAEAFTHPLSHARTAEDVLVDFDGPDDPYRPVNWPFRKKVVTTMLYGLTTMGSTMASSIYSPTPVSTEYQVDTEVSLLGISFLLLGFGLGPLIWAPVSEVYGRKPAVLLPYFVGAMFVFGTGAGENIQTILITRFFTGLFCSASVTNTGGVLGDIWHPTSRGTAMVFYSAAVVGGPIFGPIIGGAIAVSGVSWRWTQYLIGIFMTLIWLLDITILDETYPAILLVHKATRLRISTGNWALHARHEEWDPSARELITTFGIRPIQMLLTPICFSLALYASFVYAILYGNLAAFPIVFQETRGWNQLVGSLPFLAFLIGIIFGGVANVLNTQFYNKRYIANGNKPVPEARLPPMMIGSVLFAGGLFLLAWTATPNHHWVLPNVGAVMLGFGFFTIFQSALNYLIDTFQQYAASATATNTFLRSVLALSFPLFINPMYRALGVAWATSVFGFFAIALIPIPWLFYIYGPAIRKRGKYSANMG